MKLENLLLVVSLLLVVTSAKIEYFAQSWCVWKYIYKIDSSKVSISFWFWWGLKIEWDGWSLSICIYLFLSARVKDPMNVYLENKKTQQQLTCYARVALVSYKQWRRGIVKWASARCLSEGGTLGVSLDSTSDVGILRRFEAVERRIALRWTSTPTTKTQSGDLQDQLMHWLVHMRLIDLNGAHVQC